MKKPVKGLILALIIVIVILAILTIFFRKPSPPTNTIIQVEDIENQFGEISDYRRENNTPVGVESQESTTATIKNSKTSIGTQIIEYNTKAESENIFDLHVSNLNASPHDEERNISIGEKGVIYKINVGDESIFYLLFYKDKSFVTLTLNYAKASDEKELVGLAKTIEKRLNSTDS
jgi:hypothetical protein